MIRSIIKDKRTLLLKAEDEEYWAEIPDYFEKQNKPDKQKALDKLLAFTSQHRNMDNDFKFNRKDCYVK